MGLPEFANEFVDEYEIKQGPSKLDLMLAVFDHRDDKPRPVTFGLQLPPRAKKFKSRPEPLRVVITKVERYDRDGYVWNFKGLGVDANGEPNLLNLGGVKVEGILDTCDRKGRLTVTEPNNY